MDRYRVKRSAAWALAALAVPAAASAHPGPHEGDAGAGGVLHAVTQADHLIALLGIVAVAAWLPTLLRGATRWLRSGRMKASPCVDRGSRNGRA